MADADLTAAISGSVAGFKRLFYDMTSRELECPWVDERAFQKLMRHVSQNYSSKTAVTEVFRNIQLLETRVHPGDPSGLSLQGLIAAVVKCALELFSGPEWVRFPRPVDKFRLMLFLIDPGQLCFKHNQEVMLSNKQVALRSRPEARPHATVNSAGVRLPADLREAAHEASIAVSRRLGIVRERSAVVSDFRPHRPTLPLPQGPRLSADTSSEQVYYKHRPEDRFVHGPGVGARARAGPGGREAGSSRTAGPTSQISSIPETVYTVIRSHQAFGGTTADTLAQSASPGEAANLSQDVSVDELEAMLGYSTVAAPGLLSVDEAERSLSGGAGAMPEAPARRGMEPIHVLAGDISGAISMYDDEDAARVSSSIAYLYGVAAGTGGGERGGSPSPTRSKVHPGGLPTGERLELAHAAAGETSAILSRDSIPSREQLDSRRVRLAGGLWSIDPASKHGSRGDHPSLAEARYSGANVSDLPVTVHRAKALGVRPPALALPLLNSSGIAEKEPLRTGTLTAMQARAVASGHGQAGAMSRVGFVDENEDGIPDDTDVRTAAVPQLGYTPGLNPSHFTASSVRSTMSPVAGAAAAIDEALRITASGTRNSSSFSTFYGTAEGPNGAGRGASHYTQGSDVSAPNSPGFEMRATSSSSFLTTAERQLAVTTLGVPLTAEVVPMLGSPNAKRCRQTVVSVQSGSSSFGLMHSRVEAVCAREVDNPLSSSALGGGVGGSSWDQGMAAERKPSRGPAGALTAQPPPSSKRRIPPGFTCAEAGLVVDNVLLHRMEQTVVGSRGSAAEASQCDADGIAGCAYVEALARSKYNSAVTATNDAVTAHNAMVLASVNALPSRAESLANAAHRITTGNAMGIIGSGGSGFGSTTLRAGMSAAVGAETAGSDLSALLTSAPAQPAWVLLPGMIDKAMCIDMAATEGILQAIFRVYTQYGEHSLAAGSSSSANGLGTYLVPGEPREPRLYHNGFAKFALDAGLVGRGGTGGGFFNRGDVAVVFSSCVARMASVRRSALKVWKRNSFAVHEVQRSMLKLGLDYTAFTQALLTAAVKRYCSPGGPAAAEEADRQRVAASATNTRLDVDETMLAGPGAEFNSQNGVHARSLTSSHALRLLLLRHVLPLAVHLRILHSVEGAVVARTMDRATQLVPAMGAGSELVHLASSSSLHASRFVPRPLSLPGHSGTTQSSEPPHVPVPVEHWAAAAVSSARAALADVRLNMQDVQREVEDEQGLRGGAVEALVQATPEPVPVSNSPMPVESLTSLPPGRPRVDSEATASVQASVAPSVAASMASPLKAGSLGNALLASPGAFLGGIVMGATSMGSPLISAQGRAKSGGGGGGATVASMLFGPTLALSMSLAGSKPATGTHTPAVLEAQEPELDGLWGATSGAVQDRAVGLHVDVDTGVNAVGSGVTPPRPTTLPVTESKPNPVPVPVPQPTAALAPVPASAPPRKGVYSHPFPHPRHTDSSSVHSYAERARRQSKVTLPLNVSDARGVHRYVNAGRQTRQTEQLDAAMRSVGLHWQLQHAAMIQQREAARQNQGNGRLGQGLPDSPTGASTGGFTEGEGESVGLAGDAAFLPLPQSYSPVMEGALGSAHSSYRLKARSAQRAVSPEKALQLSKAGVEVQAEATPPHAGLLGLGLSHGSMHPRSSPLIRHRHWSPSSSAKRAAADVVACHIEANDVLGRQSAERRARTPHTASVAGLAMLASPRAWPHWEGHGSGLGVDLAWNDPASPESLPFHARAKTALAVGVEPASVAAFLGGLDPILSPAVLQSHAYPSPSQVWAEVSPAQAPAFHVKGGQFSPGRYRYPSPYSFAGAYGEDSSVGPGRALLRSRSWSSSMGSPPSNSSSRKSSRTGPGATYPIRGIGAAALNLLMQQEMGGAAEPVYGYDGSPPRPPRPAPLYGPSLAKGQEQEEEEGVMRSPGLLSPEVQPAPTGKLRPMPSTERIQRAWQRRMAPDGVTPAVEVEAEDEGAVHQPQPGFDPLFSPQPASPLPSMMMNMNKLGSDAALLGLGLGGGGAALPGFRIHVHAGGVEVMGRAGAGAGMGSGAGTLHSHGTHLISEGPGVGPGYLHSGSGSAVHTTLRLHRSGSVEISTSGSDRSGSPPSVLNPGPWPVSMAEAVTPPPNAHAHNTGSMGPVAISPSVSPTAHATLQGSPSAAEQALADVLALAGAAMGREEEEGEGTLLVPGGAPDEGITAAGPAAGRVLLAVTGGLQVLSDGLQVPSDLRAQDEAEEEAEEEVEPVVMATRIVGGRGTPRQVQEMPTVEELLQAAMASSGASMAVSASVTGQGARPWDSLARSSAPAPVMAASANRVGTTAALFRFSDLTSSRSSSGQRR